MKLIKQFSQASTISKSGMGTVFNSTVLLKQSIQANIKITVANAANAVKTANITNAKISNVANVAKVANVANVAKVANVVNAAKAAGAANPPMNPAPAMPKLSAGGLTNILRLLTLIVQTARLFKLSNTGVKQMQEDLKKIAELEEKVNQLQDKLNGKGKQGGGAGGGLLDKIKGLAGQYLNFDTFKELGGKALSGGMELQKLQDTFKARTGDDQVGTAMFQKFKADAVKSGVDVNEFLKGTLSFFPQTKNTNQLEKINNLALRLNAFDNEGKGLGDNISVLKEAMSGNTASLAGRYNMSEASIKASKIEDLGKAGDLNGFINAFDKLLEKENMGKKALETMLATPAKQVEALGNHFQTSLATAGQGALQALQPLLATLNTAFQEGKFDPFFNALQAGLNVVAWLVTSLVDRFLQVSDAIQSNWSTASNIILAVAAAIATMLIPVLWAALVPILELALASWPILLVAAAVGILVYYLLNCGITAEQIVGVIVGSFMVLYGVVWNIVAMLWNVFASFGEGLINIFIDSTYSVKKLFYDLAVTFGGFLISMAQGVEDFAGGFMTTILKGINGILKGFNWLADGVNSMFGLNIGQAKLFDENNIHAISDSMRDMMDQLEKPVSDKDVAVIGRMDYKDLKNEFDFGYSSGATLVNKLSSLQGSLDPNKQTSILDGWNQKNNNIDRVGVVGQIDDTVDVTSEDIKVMRDLAEMQNIQNFVTLTPTVQVTTGDINNPTDVNEMIRRIEDVMVREISNSAQGVYG